MSGVSAAASWMRSHAKAIGGALVGLATITATVMMVVAEIKKPSMAGSDQPAIIVTSPKDGIVARCARFVGSAPVLDGYDLWLSYESPYKNFAFAKADHRPDGVWTRESTVGGKDDAGVDYIVRIFYLTKEDSGFLGGVRGLGNDGSEGYWFANQLPVKVFHTFTVTVTRDSLTNVPPCGES